MTLNSRQRRILRRRSPPRIVTIDGGKGILTPKHIVKPIDIKPVADPYKLEIDSINPILVEIISTGEMLTPPNPESEKTTVVEQKGQDAYPRIAVSKINSKHLRKKQLTKESNEKEEQEKPERLPLLGSGTFNRKVRRQRTAAILADGALLEPGTRQVWKLSETYDKRFKDSAAELKLHGEQGIRITFHRDAGGIIQALELPPSNAPVAVGVPLGTRFFTLEGLGGKGYIKSNSDVRNESITIRYPKAEFSAVGFQRTSKIHQIGMFRYLARGAYLQARESFAQETMEKRTVFHAGEVLSKIDDIRFYCTGHIKTFVLIVKTAQKAQPAVQIAMEGVKAQRRPSVIRRDDGFAYVWPVKEPEGYMGPTIIDIRTDETTDVHSAIGYAANSELVLEFLKENRWTQLVGQGPITHSGKSITNWNITKPPLRSEVMDSSHQKEEAKNRQKKVEKEIKQPEEKRPKPVIKEEGLPRIELPGATVGDEYSFDVSIFAKDDDEGDQILFKKTSGPSWLNLTVIGELIGVPSSIDVGLNECIVSVIDKEGLSSEAVLVIEVNEKILNRAPYWNPNVKISKEPSSQKPTVGKEKSNDLEKMKKDIHKSKSKSRSRRRRS